MPELPADAYAAHLIEPRGEALDVLGPTIEFLTAPGKEDNAPCVMRGTIAPGVVVPLHSHPDPETYVSLSGEIEGLVESNGRYRWLSIKPGDVFHVPGGARHAFRNQGRAPVVMIIVSTAKMGRFFRDIGTPVAPGTRPPGPSHEIIERFLNTAAVYGYWNAGPEENARIGLSLPPPA